MRKKSILLSFVLVFFSIASFTIYAQDNKEAKDQSKPATFSLKDGNTYTFSANFMYPLRGRSRSLTPPYDLTFSKDTLAGSLPYVGEAYQASYGSRDGGVNLQTANFTYQETKNKKGNYVISYKVKGGQDVSDAVFTIYKDGTAELRMNFTQRQSISYRGNVTLVAAP